MKFGDKEFAEYWKIIKIPTYILIAWSVLGLIIGMVSYSTYLSIFSSLTGWLLVVAIFTFIGWTAVKDHKLKIKIAAWSGALSGAISGAAGAIIGILMYYLVPEVVKAAMAQASQAGVDISAIQGFMVIGIYIGLITGPLISALIGGAIAALAGFIATKIR
jgi:hypothetical protein